MTRADGHRLARRRVRRQIVARGKLQCKRCAAAHFALDRDRPIQLFDDALRDGETEAEPARFGGHKIFKDRGEPIGRNP